MGKRSVVPPCGMLFCGIDVSAATLAVAVQPEPGQGFTRRGFPNTAKGHRKLIAWLGRWKAPVRVALEATGILDADLARKFELLTGIKGVGEVSAVHLLGELAGLDPDMTVRQWVAHSGLDPMHQVSGTSVHKASWINAFRISRRGSRHLRRALYMPALSAARFDPHLKAFYTLLLTRQKTKMQALIAVARKLLHAIFGIFKTGTAWDGAKLFPKLLPTS